MGRSRGSVFRRAGAGVVAVGVLVMVAGLVGCGPGVEPSPAPTGTGPVDPSPRERITTLEPTVYPRQTPDLRPEAVLPERPVAMDQVDVAGAEAVATYFLHLYPYVYATGDLTAWRELSHPECVFCRSVIDNVSALVEIEHTIEGGLITWEDAEVVEVDPGYWYSVELDIDEGATTERDADGRVVEERPSILRTNLFFALIYDGSWQVRELDVTSLEEVAE